jgi:acetyl esterase/lipase
VPGAIQDAAAVYAHLVTHHLGALKGPDGKYHYPDSPIPHHTDAHDSPTPHPTSATSISQETVSPSAEAGPRQHIETSQGHVDQCDLVEPQISGNDATLHPVVNIVDSTQANTGRVTESHRPRIILIGDSAGGNLVLALARWIRDEGVLPLPDGMILLSPSCDPCMIFLITI